MGELVAALADLVVLGEHAVDTAQSPREAMASHLHGHRIVVGGDGASGALQLRGDGEDPAAGAEHLVAFDIKARGYGRRNRRFYLDEETAALVKRVAELPPPS